MSEVVENIQYFTGKKQFLGGYKNKLTDKVYHHANIQTLPLLYNNKKVFTEKFHRNTQTISTRNKSLQTVCDTWTQVEELEIYLSSDHDKILFPSSLYVSADEILQKQLKAVITIQRYWRRWLARQELSRRKAANLNAQEEEKETQNKLKILQETWIKELDLRRKNPHTKDDFTLLFQDLQEWFDKQVESLKKQEDGAALKASLYLLLNEEVEKIRELNRQRQEVKKQEAIKNRHVFLNKVAKPKIWKASKKLIEVETQGTQTAKTLRNLYDVVARIKLTPEDRISALTDLKIALEPFRCASVSDLTVLVDREIDLLKRNVKEEHLQGLRTRIRNTVWQIARQPAFNTEIKKYAKFSSESGVKPHIMNCISCNQYYILSPNSLDEPNIEQNRFAKCKNCKYLKNEGWIRKGIEFHKNILKLLIIKEEMQKEISGIIYLMQPRDMVYLVDKIWKAKSFLSGSSELGDLELARWNINKLWSPWNCILLTKEEAKFHNGIIDCKHIYAEKVMQSIYLKHLEARRHFSKIPRFLPFLSLKFSTKDYVVEK